MRILKKVIEIEIPAKRRSKWEVRILSGGRLTTGNTVSGSPADDQQEDHQKTNNHHDNHYDDHYDDHHEDQFADQMMILG